MDDRRLRRHSLGNAVRRRNDTMNKKTIFITGTSSGLGRATAKLFSSRGWTVIATMRIPEKEAELGSPPGVVLCPLDIPDRQQIETTVERALPMGVVDDVFN